MVNRSRMAFLCGLLVVGMGLSAALARSGGGGGFRGAAPGRPGGFEHGGVSHGGPVGVPHGGPAFHPGGGFAPGHAEFARHAGPAFHNPALFHSPGAHWNGYHQVFVGGRPMHLGWAGYRPSFYYHPWYHGPWSGHQWGWGWGYSPGISFGFGGGGFGVGVGTGWGYGGYVSPYGVYGYAGRPVGWGFGGWGLGTIAYSSGYNPYYNPYYAPYGGQPVVYNYTNPIPVAAQPPPGTVAADDGPSPQPENPAFDAARDEFRRGHYSAALNSVDAAIRVAPTDAVVHEFRSLVLFALRDYKQAAGVAHSVLAVGPGWDWTSMSSLYADPEVYEQQLRALEDYTQTHPRAADAHFLLGYHYMIASHAEEAVHEFQLVAKLMPTDRLAGELLLMVKGPPKDQPPSSAAAGGDGAAPAEVPTPPALDKALLPGIWHASRDDGSKFRLTIAEDGKFNWKFSVPRQKGDEFSGTYTVDGPVLALERKAGGVLAGTATFADDGSFNFRMVGAPPQDKGLDFRR